MKIPYCLALVSIFVTLCIGCSSEADGRAEIACESVACFAKDYSDEFGRMPDSDTIQKHLPEYMDKNVKVDASWHFEVTQANHGGKATKILVHVDGPNIRTRNWTIDVGGQPSASAKS